MHQEIVQKYTANFNEQVHTFNVYNQIIHVAGVHTSAKDSECSTALSRVE
jgi:hypothetical protein